MRPDLAAARSVSARDSRSSRSPKSAAYAVQQVADAEIEQGDRQAHYERRDPTVLEQDKQASLFLRHECRELHAINFNHVWHLPVPPHCWRTDHGDHPSWPLGRLTVCHHDRMPQAPS